MDLSIETLVGTSFELRVSPFETIMGVKVKIQRLEGIPVTQQHLIWRSMELKDDCSLHDYSISNGSCLKLVLAMRGGPINTRRVSVEDPTLQEMTEYMEANRSEILDKLIQDDNQVTLLVFRDGDQLNFYRVYDRGDGTLTPLSDSISPASLCEVHSEDAADDDHEDASNSDQPSENEVIRTKITSLRQKMACARKSTDTQHAPRPPSTDKPDTAARRRLPFAPLRRYTASSSTPSRGGLCANGNLLTKSSMRTPLPPLSRKSTSSSSSNQGERNIDFSEPCDDKDPFEATSYHTSPFERSTAPLPSLLPDRHDYTPTSSTRPPESLNKLTSFNQSHLTKRDKQGGSKPMSRSSRHAILRRVVEIVPSNNPLTGEETPSKLDMERSRFGKPPDASRWSYPSTSTVSTLPLLPNATVATTEVTARKKRQRCTTCRKRLGLATTFQCRCGSDFCGMHRYPETHQCSYDYKSEGRKTLHRNNPIVAAPKLPKI